MNRPDYPDFYEEIPVTEPVVEDPKPVEEPKKEDTRAHILTPEQMEAWKNGDEAGPVLRRAADVEAEKEKEVAKPKEDAKPVVDTVPAAALPQMQAVDPGEYQPQDYSFDVTIYDAEGKNGKAVKIASVEQFDELLEKDSNFGSYAALAKAQRAADKMEVKAEGDLSAWEAAKAEFDTEQGSVTERMAEINNIAAEMDYLASKGQLPALTKELKEADWNDPEIAGQAGVKEWKDLIAYMGRENDIRIKAGLARMTSPVSAYREMKLEQMETGQTDAAKRAAEARKAAGARVGGSSPAPATAAPRGISVGRVSPGGLRDMGVRG